MILILLGTQDKPFVRLLNAIEKQIKLGNITDEVIVQAGHTKFESENMTIYDLIPNELFETLVNKANIIITHGGVGSIVSGLKRNKIIIAAARLKKYGEHVNDHQLEIIDTFSKSGYIIKLDDFDKLDIILEQAASFKPVPYKSNTKAVINLIDEFIENI